MTPAAPSPRARLLAETIAVLLAVWLPWAITSLLIHRDPELSGAEQLAGALSALGTLALLAFLVWRNGEGWGVLGLRPTRAWLELCWGAAFCALAWLAGDAVRHLLAELGFERGPPTRLHIPYLVPLDYLLFAACEEVLYRGYLWTRLQQLTGSNTIALLGTSLLFTLPHGYPLHESIEIFAFGLLAGAFWWRGRSTPRLIAGHCAYNLLLHYCM